MNEDDLRRAFGAVEEREPPVAVCVDQVVIAGRTRVRRRRTLKAAVGVTVGGLVTLVGVNAAALLDAPHTDRSFARPTTEATPLPPPASLAEATKEAEWALVHHLDVELSDETFAVRTDGAVTARGSLRAGGAPAAQALLAVYPDTAGVELQSVDGSASCSDEAAPYAKARTRGDRDLVDDTVIAQPGTADFTGPFTSTDPGRWYCTIPPTPVSSVGTLRRGELRYSGLLTRAHVRPDGTLVTVTVDVGGAEQMPSQSDDIRQILETLVQEPRIRLPDES